MLIRKRCRFWLFPTTVDRVSQVAGSISSPKLRSPNISVRDSLTGEFDHVEAKSHGIGVISQSSYSSRFAISALGGKGSLGIQLSDF